MRRPTAIFESHLYLETSVLLHYLDLNFLFSGVDSDLPLYVLYISWPIYPHTVGILCSDTPKNSDKISITDLRKCLLIRSKNLDVGISTKKVFKTTF